MNTNKQYLNLKLKGYQLLLNLNRPLFWWYYKLETRRRQIHLQAGTSGEINERPYEYAFALQHLPYGENIKVLDVGTGKTAFGALLKNCNYFVDCLESTQYRRGWLPLNTHCNLINDDIVNTVLPENTYDAVTCISVLEHIEQYDQAVKNMVKILKPGGRLILTIPFNHNRFIENCYTQKESNRHQQNVSIICKVYSIREMEKWCTSNNARVGKQVLGRCWSGPFWNSGEWLRSYNIVTKEEQHDHCCLVLIKNE